MTAEYPLLHPEFLHLLQDHGSGFDIRPQNDRIDAGILDHLKLVSKIGIAPHELLLDHYRMAEAAGGIFELEHAEAAVTIVDP